jgi:hypothetical protein
MTTLRPDNVARALLRRRLAALIVDARSLSAALTMLEVMTIIARRLDAKIADRLRSAPAERDARSFLH